MKSFRSFVYNIAFFGGSTVLMTVALPLLVGPRRWTNWLAHFWTWSMFALLKLIVGLDYEVRGRENLPEGPAILAMKHQSAWDTLAIFILFDDPAVVLKRELWLIPVFGWFLRKHGTIAIDRKGKAAALKKLVADAVEAKSIGRPIVIFPEGTRGPVGTKLPYQPAWRPSTTSSRCRWCRSRSFRALLGAEILHESCGAGVGPDPAADPAGLQRREVMGRLEHDIETATGALLAEAGWRDKPVENSVDGSTAEA